MNKYNGFTLIELMMVISMIAIIGSIAIPNILDFRRSGQESGAMSTLNANILPAMHQYRSGAYQDEARSAWGVFPAHISALAGGDGASIHSTSDLAQCRMPGSIKLLPSQFNNHDGKGGTNVGHYRFGAGTTEGFYEDRGVVVDGYVYTVLQSAEKTDQGKHLRQMYVTVIASPVNPSSGMRAFGFTINPGIYDHLVAMTSAENRTFQLMKDAQYYPENGMFKNPRGPEKEADLGWGHGPKATYINK